MKVILKETVDKLGYKDDIVDVRPGYARNYLLPQGIAVAATPSAVKMLEETLRQRAHKENKILEDAQALAAKIAGVSIKIGAKAGETGKIFGSVNNIQIADALAGEGITVDRKSISIVGETIKELGQYQAEINIHREVSQTIDFEVVGE